MNNLQHDIKFILDLIKKKNFLEVKSRLDKLTKNNPSSPFLKNFEGFCYSEIGELDNAISCFQAAIILDKLYKYAHYNLGLTFQKKKLYYQAIDFFKSAITIDNNYYDANLNLAHCYKKLKDFEKSEFFFNKCIKLNPNTPDAYNNISLVYLAQKKIDLALNSLKKALEIAPSMFGIYNNIGLIFINLKNYPEAILNFKKVIEGNPNSYDAYNNIALALFHLEKYNEALKVSKMCLNIKPDFVKGHWTLSLILKKLGKYTEAVIAAEKCLLLNKSFYPIYSQLITLHCEMCEHEKAEGLINNILKLNKEQQETFDSEDIQVSIFHCNYINNFQNENYIKLVDIYKNNFFKENIVVKKKELKFSNDIIRIGFISGDFKEHAVTFQLSDIFEALNIKKNIEIYAYSNNLKDDNLTKKIINNFKSFKIIHSISDEDLAKLINSDNIDVLIDLSGHTTANRLTVFKYKPAKICITWAGYLASTQLPNIDYIIADKFTIPLHEEKNYSEKIIRLSSWSTLSEIQNNIEVPLESPCSYNNYITFGSINNISKINYEVIELWSKILLNIPNSKLLIKNHQLDSLDIREIIKQKFSKFNVNEKKIILRGSSSREDLLKTYNEIDIALDPFPYGGGTTNLETAWMCVPILTRVGNSFLSRCGESINNNLGLSNWIAANNDEYYEKALKYSNQETINDAKRYLKEKKNKSILFNPKKLADELVINIQNILSNNLNY